jgi:hypothetical protein
MRKILIVMTLLVGLLSMAATCDFDPFGEIDHDGDEVMRSL